MHTCPDCGLSCDCEEGEDSVAECWHCDPNDDGLFVGPDDEDDDYDDEDTGDPWDDDD